MDRQRPRQVGQCSVALVNYVLPAPVRDALDDVVQDGNDGDEGDVGAGEQLMAAGEHLPQRGHDPALLCHRFLPVATNSDVPEPPLNCLHGRPLQVSRQMYSLGRFSNLLF